jgi:hypothetical protein
MSGSRWFPSGSRLPEQVVPTPIGGTTLEPVGTTKDGNHLDPSDIDGILSALYLYGEAYILIPRPVDNSERVPDSGMCKCGHHGYYQHDEFSLFCITPLCDCTGFQS